MKIGHRLLLLAGMLWCPLLGAVSLVTEDYPPFNRVNPKNGEVTGLSTEKVQELMRRAGEKYTLSAYSWSNAVQLTQNNLNTCVFSTARTPARENLYKWVGPLAINNWMIFGRADDERKPKNLDDLRPFVIGSYRNDAVGEYFSVRGYTTELAGSEAENPRKLLYGSFDFWATGELMGKDLLKQQGLSKLIVPLFAFTQTDLYLACHPEMSQDKVDRWNQILRDMEKDGASSAIEKKYK
jgi:polar amino acid transport system substrate-binding protein